MKTNLHYFKVRPIINRFLTAFLIITSSAMTVFANPDIDGGTLEGGPFEFCVDGDADNVSGITLTGNNGTNNQWVVTDLAGNILGLPPMRGVVDFDVAGTGVCLIWNIAFEDGLIGLEADLNVGDLEGCFGISNAVYVYRSTSGVGCDADCEAVGGTVEGGPFEFCVDGEADNVSGITLNGNSGVNNQWVVTDESGMILGLPPFPSAMDFEGAGEGLCLLWHLAFEDGIEGLEAGANAGDLVGCFSLSNAIEVNRVTSGPLCTTATDEELLSNLTIYPNPASDFINLNLGDVDISNGTIVISDYQGRVVKRTQFDNNVSVITIETDNIINGIYLLSIRTDENYISRKLVISRY